MHDPGSSSGLPAGATIAGLSSAEDATLCNWFADQLGGYGRSRVCGTDTTSSPPSEATCVSDYQSLSPSCPVTVGDLEECVNAVVSGPCTAGTFPSGCLNLVSSASNPACPQ